MILFKYSAALSYPMPMQSWNFRKKTDLRRFIWIQVCSFCSLAAWRWLYSVWCGCKQKSCPLFWRDRIFSYSGSAAALGSHFLLRRKWATGLDLHFSFPQRERKIEVETSVCTGFSKCPPDTCIQMGSSPVFLANNKSTPFGVLLLFGCGGRTRTYDLRVMRTLRMSEKSNLFVFISPTSRYFNRFCWLFSNNLK